MSVRATDIAYSHLLEAKDGVPFKDLWNAVKDELGYNDELANRKVSQFYTDLSIDGRFIQLDNKAWNLKSHCKYDEVKAIQEEIPDEADEEEEGDEEYIEESAEETEDY